MTIEQTGVVDFIGRDRASGDVVLTVLDHLEWGGEDREHVRLLQDKLYSYLDFIESGEIYESYPNAKGRKLLIEVIGQYPLNDFAEEFYLHARGIVTEVGVELKFTLFKSSQYEGDSANTS